jgi:hypothetical protein
MPRFASQVRAARDLESGGRKKRWANVFSGLALISLVAAIGQMDVTDFFRQARI